jgi:hypothetical protein
MVYCIGRERDRAVSSEAAWFLSTPSYGEQFSQTLCPTAAGRTGNSLKHRFFLRGDEAFRATAGSRVADGSSRFSLRGEAVRTVNAIQSHR